MRPSFALMLTLALGVACFDKSDDDDDDDDDTASADAGFGWGSGGDGSEDDPDDQNSDGGDGGSGGSDAERYTRALCEWFIACGVGEEIGFGSVSECVENELSSVEEGFASCEVNSMYLEECIGDLETMAIEEECSGEAPEACYYICEV